MMKKEMWSSWMGKRQQALRQEAVLHHFRSSTSKREEEYLQKCWNECLENRVTLPIKDIWVEGEHGQMKIIRDAFKDTTDSNNDVGIDQEQPTTGNAFLYNILEWNS